MKVYAVIGEAGDYSGREEWVVAAYTSIEPAQRHAELAQAEGRELMPEGNYGAWRNAKLSKWDGNMQGPCPQYHVEEIDLHGEMEPVERVPQAE